MCQCWGQKANEMRLYLKETADSSGQWKTNLKTLRKPTKMTLKFPKNLKCIHHLRPGNESLITISAIPSVSGPPPSQILVNSLLLPLK